MPLLWKDTSLNLQFSFVLFSKKISKYLESKGEQCLREYKAAKKKGDG